MVNEECASTAAAQSNYTALSYGADRLRECADTAQHQVITLLGTLSPPIYAQRLIDDPGVSTWLKSAILACLRRDPVDALNDALVLASVMEIHCREVANAAMASKDNQF